MGCGFAGIQLDIRSQAPPSPGRGRRSRLFCLAGKALFTITGIIVNRRPGVDGHHTRDPEGLTKIAKMAKIDNRRGFFMSQSEALPRRLLLVEDEPKLAKTYHGILAAAGFDVVEAATGAQALKTIEKEPFDVVVTKASIRGIDGIDLVRQFCQRVVGIPIILMLESLDNKLAVRGLEAGAQQYLVKPLDAEALKRTVVHALRLLRKVATPTPPHGALSELQSVTATRAKNAFASVLETVLQGHRVVITKHDTPKAVVVPYEEYKAVAEQGARQLDTLTAEFDELLARMQTPAARAGMKAAFNASPTELGKAAVAAVRKRG